jgi:hypothetical protein
MLRVMPQNWEEDQANRVAQEIRRLRHPRSAQWLSDRTGELGHRISRPVISDLENGRRRYVTTAELCVLAWALKVPPVALLYPDLPDGPVEVVPGVDKSSIEAVMWFSGELVYGHLGDEPAEFLAVKAGAEPLELARERITLAGQIATWSKLAAAIKEPAVAQTFVDQIENGQARIDAINDRLQQIAAAKVQHDAR